MDSTDDALSAGVKAREKLPLRRIAHSAAILVPILFVTGVSIEGTRGKPPHPTLDPNLQLVQAEISSRIMMQQLDELFDNLATSIRERGELTEQDAKLLRLWKDYDEQFLISTRDNSSLRYMRANARFRLGLIEQLLGNPAAAIRQFQKAAELLEIVAAESPRVTSYQGELVYCWINAAESALNSGDRETAAHCVGELDRLFSRSGLANDPDFRGYQQILASLKNWLAS